MKYTTLNKIKKYSPCSSGWETLLSSLGKTKSDDEQLSILTILNSNGLDDALWALQATDATDKEMRLYAVWCARQVQRLAEGSSAVIDVSERYANGNATDDELDSAWASARASAWASARDSAWAWAWTSARASAWAWAWTSARDSAWASARDSARASARASAWASARDSARDSAWAMASQKEQFIKMFCEVDA